MFETTITGFEADTRKLMKTAFTLSCSTKAKAAYCRETKCLAQAFVAAHLIAQSAERWIALAQALTNWTLDEKRAHKALTQMVREGYLRSRVGHTGKRLYEVNY